MVPLIAFLALLMGAILGLLGGGGSILTVPILKYVAGMSSKQAIASSLIVVGLTCAVAAVSHARRGNVEFRVGLLFGGVAMLGAYMGGRLARYVPGWVLLTLFAALMIATSLLMLRKSRKQKSAGAEGTSQGQGTQEGASEAEGSMSSFAVIALEGFVVGLVTGLIGAGGGFMIVPALVILGGLPMHKAVGTSLFVIALKSSAALAGHLGHVSVDWELTLIVAGCAVLGSLFGARFSARVPAATLKVIFAWFVLAMGTAILSRELWPML